MLNNYNIINTGLLIIFQKWHFCVSKSNFITHANMNYFSYKYLTVYKYDFKRNKAIEIGEKGIITNGTQ